MPRKRKARRTKSPHPGVVLVSSPLPRLCPRRGCDGQVLRQKDKSWLCRVCGESFAKEKTKDTGSRWRARWRDPVTGRYVWQDLAKLGHTSTDARTAWAIDKSESLAAELSRIKSGKAARTRTTPEDAVTEYLERRKPEVAERTLAVYQESLDRFPAWADRVGLRFVEDLTPKLLADFRTTLVNRRKARPVSGGRQGEHRSSRAKLSEETVNRDFRTVRVFLHALRKVGQVPRLDSDAISDGLRALKAKRPVPRFLRVTAIRKLLKAAARHDAETWTMTREEKSGVRPVGSSPRHPPIEAFVRTVLLTGASLNEVLGLTWDEVLLEEGTIELDAERVKTGRGRRIDLDVSPSLAPLLAELQVRAAGEPHVFHWLTQGIVAAARKRLTKAYGAPKFTWQELRRTCGTFLTCAPAIYGAASAFLSAKRLGHGVLVAEKHYVGALTGISAQARTLEGAMGIEGPGGAARMGGSQRKTRVR